MTTPQPTSRATLLWRRASMAALLLAMALGGTAALLAGCTYADRYALDPDRVITASPLGARAIARVPSYVSAPAVIAAAEQTLQARGYVITRDQPSEGLAVVVGRLPERGLRRLLARRVTVRAELVERTVKVVVNVEPEPDLAEARAVLRETLTLLTPRKKHFSAF